MENDEETKSTPKKRKAASAPPPPPARGASPIVIAAVIALAVGGAGGWFGHEGQAKAKLRADSAAAVGSGAPSGSCGAWEKKICSGTGDQSAACAEAKGAVDLLTPATCDAALAAVPATLAKVKAGRASCDSLVGKLCADLPPGSPACGIVKERTPSFPSARCDDMLKHYAEVIGELRQLDQQQAMQGTPGMPGMAPPGAAPMDMAQAPAQSPAPAPH